MESTYVDEAIALLEKANAGLEPELVSRADGRKLLDAHARVERLAAFGIATLSRGLDDAAQIARATGTSIGKARETVATGKVLHESGALHTAMQSGEISMDQATEIARAETSAPGAATELLAVARDQSFHVLKEKARKATLEAEQHRDLGQRQHAARSARSYSDELGMVHVHLALEPHVGAPIVTRAETEAARLARAAQGQEGKEPFERHLADAYARLLSGSGSGTASRAEMVVVVSHEVAARGWTEVRAGEVCKIPGIGPIPAPVAKDIAEDAFVTGVLYDGKDLRQIKRWSRSIPVEVALALRLGDPPDFDGVACVDCGNRFRTEIDHVEPRASGGATCTENLRPRCRRCHKAKTASDRRAGKLTPPEP